MEFTLKIKLGNEAMQTSGDIAGALVQVASGVMSRFGENANMAEQGDDDGKVQDGNGNTVGEWRIT